MALFDRARTDTLVVGDQATIERIGDPDFVLDTISIVDQVTSTPTIYRERFVDLGMYILGGKKAYLNIAIQGEVQLQVGLDMEIEAEPIIYIGLDMLIVNELPYRFMKLRKDLTTRYFGGFASSTETFDPPNPFATIVNDIGVFNNGHWKLVYSAPNTIPTPGAFDKYSFPVGSQPVSVIGTRCLINFQLNSFGDNSNVMFGFCNDGLDPFASIASGNICAFALETEKGHVEFRAWYGPSSTLLNLGSAVPISRFIGRDLLFELELVDVGAEAVIEFRLYEMDVSLSVPFFSVRVSTAAAVTIDRFFITSLGKRAPENPDSVMSVSFKYLDAETGTGVLYDASAGIAALDAKWRPFQNRPPIELLQEGVNQVFVALSADGIASNIETNDTITVDSSDPQIVVLSFNPESSVIVPGTVNPPVVKGSLNSGFDEVTFTWSASHIGDYTLRIDSTSPNDGTEILSGSYTTIGAQIVTTWNFADLPSIDGTYEVTLYLVTESGKYTAKQLGIFILPFSPKIQSLMNISIV